MVVFEHVIPRVTRRTQSLDRFQEFVMVLMKLRLNVPFQDLAYRFTIHGLDGGDGCQIVPLVYCAGKGAVMANHADVFSVSFRKKSHSDH